MTTRVVQRDLQGRHGRRQTVVLPCQQAEFDELTPVEVMGQLLPHLGADRAVEDELIGGAQQRLLPVLLSLLVVADSYL